MLAVDRNRAMIDKIGPNNISRFQPTAKPAAAPAVNAAAGKPAVDQASLSTRARELSLAREAARQAPDVRADRVAALRQQIAAGTYHVSDDLLAQKILDFIA
jgi:negative regulator of flagellin synthesis FlgM